MKKVSPKPKESSLLNTHFFQSVIIFLFHFLVISVPLFFTFNTSELFEFNKMVLTYGITVLIATAWIARMIVSGRLIFKRTFLDLPLLIFVISQLLSVIFSIHPYTSLLGYYSRFHGGFVSVLTYVLLYYAFTSNVQKKHLSSFFLSLTAAGVIVSLYAFLEHFGHSVSCLIVTGGTDFGVSCWIQDVKNRVFATFGQPNWLAAYLIMLLPLSTALALKTYKSWYVNLFYILSTILFFVVVLFTQSRSGFLGAVIGMVVFLLVAVWQLFKQKKLKSFVLESKKNVLTLMFGLVISTVLVGTTYIPFLNTLFVKNSVPESSQVISQSDPVVNRLDVGGTDSGEIRKIVWQGAFKVWQRYPLFGSGLETFGYSYYQDRPLAHNMVSEWDFLYNKAHNEFLNFLATTGIVGLGSYVVLLGWFIVHTLKYMMNSAKPGIGTAQLLAATLGAIVAISVSNFFGFSTVMITVLMYLYFGIVFVLTSEDRDDANTPSLTNTSYLLLSVTALVTLFLLRMVFQYWSADASYAHGKALLEAGYFEQGSEELNEAITKGPKEATFYDELATQYALYAVAYAQEGQNAEAQALMTAAIKVSDVTLQLNPRQLNYYKTRARVFITLAQLNPELLQNAKQSLEQARIYAPTDPKLLYNLGIVEISLSDTTNGINHLSEAVEMKPNYETARWQLATALEAAQRPAEALEQLQYINSNLSPTNQQVIDKIASLSAQLEQTEEVKK